jgi:hypothetical protein
LIAQAASNTAVSTTNGHIAYGKGRRIDAVVENHLISDIVPD